jgi:Phosphotransferase enzyme family
MHGLATRMTRSRKPTEVHLAGGEVNETVLVDGTVRRKTGPWTPAVHALLRHLEAQDFPASKVLGFDEQGREMLSFIPGSHATDPDPVPPVLRGDSGVEQAAKLLRRYHDAVRVFKPDPLFTWRSGAKGLDGQELICHCDPGPWNTIWNGDRLVGLIDFDLAEPGTAAFDVGFALWFFVPFRPDAEVATLFEGSKVDRRARAGLFLEAYGWKGLRGAIDLVLDAQNVEYPRWVARAKAGLEPWATFVAKGLHKRNRAHHAWLTQHRAQFE